MTDPYLNPDNAYIRLLNDYKKHKSLIVAVDFDGTIFDFFNEGTQYPIMIELLKRCNKHNLPLIIFTANTNHLLIETYCKEIDIKIEGININYLTQFSNSGKIYYNILLDDRAGLETSYNILNRVLNYIEEEK